MLDKDLERVASTEVVTTEAVPVAVPLTPEALAEQQAERRRLLWRAVVELLHDVSIAVVFCFLLITFVGQAFRVQGPSMEPLLRDGERIVVNKLIYRMSAIERGDVVVFYYPHDPSVSYIKRVVGRPDDLVEIRRGEVYVNDHKLDEPYLIAENRDDVSMAPTRIPKGFYFVLGDHRNTSRDSREWGEVPEKYIFGKAAFCFWPLSQASRIR